MYRPRIENLEDRKLFSVTTAAHPASLFNGTQGDEMAYKSGALGDSSPLPYVEQDGLYKFSASISVSGARTESVSKDEQISIGNVRSGWYFILPSGDLLVSPHTERDAAAVPGLRPEAVDRVMAGCGDGQAESRGFVLMDGSVRSLSGTGVFGTGAIIARQALVAREGVYWFDLEPSAAISTRI